MLRFGCGALALAVCCWSVTFKKSGFDLMAVCVGYVVDKVTMGHVFL